MNIRLTDAEIFVLTTVLERGDRPSGDLEPVWAEGMRSLIARYLARKQAEPGQFIIDEELEVVMRELLASRGSIAFITESDDGEGMVVNAVSNSKTNYVITPVVDGVWDLVQLDAADLAAAACQLARSVGPVSVEVLVDNEHIASHQLSFDDKVLTLDGGAHEGEQDVASELEKRVANDFVLLSSG